MTNKYLEKIAKELGKDEKKSRSAAWGTMGRSMGFGALGGAAVPLVGGIAGGVYGYRTGIEKHAPNVKKEDLTREAVRGYARSQGRGIVEGVGGAAAGGAAGAGIAAGAAKLLKKGPTKLKNAVAIGAGVGAAAGYAGGAIHGMYKSTKNKLDELTKRKK